MECKETGYAADAGVVGVLIETLWNVKDLSAPGCVGDFPVLIETLWNVKIYSLKF